MGLFIFGLMIFAFIGYCLYNNFLLSTRRSKKDVSLERTGSGDNLESDVLFDKTSLCDNLESDRGYEPDFHRALEEKQALIAKKSNKKNLSSNNKLEISLVRLDELLKNKDFESANMETYYLLRARCGIQKKDWISPQDIRNCDRDYLETIDKLWAINSGNRFGFTIQKEIWKKLHGDKLIYESSGNESKEFTDGLGWTINGVQVLLNDYNFTIDAPIGHLPVIAKPGRINLATNVETYYESKFGSWVSHLQEIWKIL
jgi:hypothetical protein